ncbi:alpha/beta fold hydrolase [Olivibacter domesticus]|nr:alpha/beta hydrolase [Olivibacter domesticus]
MLPLVEALSSHHTCVLIHQRGSGLSEIPIRPDTVQLDYFIDDIKAVALALEHEHLSLAGHSWGGMLSMIYATRHPHQVEKLLLIGSGGTDMAYLNYFTDNLYSNLSLEDQHFFRTIYAEIAQLAQHPDSAIVPEELLSLSLQLSNLLLKGYFYDKQMAASIVLTETDLNLMVKDYVETALVAAKWNINTALAGLNVPTLIVQGRQDPMDLETASRTQAALKNSTLHIIERCGHFPWIEQPEEFYRVTSGFLP